MILRGVYKDGELTETQIIFLEKIISVNPYMKLENQYEDFRQMEAEIFAYPMTSKEKDILLLATAIGKHSALYWNDVINNSKHPWHKWLPKPDQPRYLLAKKKWTKEDAKGAVAGAIGGGVSGIPGGVGGVLLGATLGAVGGAIGASAASALFD